MIIEVPVELNEIYEKGYDYPWKKPEVCPHFGLPRLWGHGFVTSYFDPIMKCLYLRRYRCPDCKCVIRMKPTGFFKRFRASIQVIRSCLSHRLRFKRWVFDLSQSRQRHWMSALKRVSLAHFGIDGFKNLLNSFEQLIQMGLIPVSRGI